MITLPGGSPFFQQHNIYKNKSKVVSLDFAEQNTFYADLFKAFSEGYTVRVKLDGKPEANSPFLVLVDHCQNGTMDIKTMVEVLMVAIRAMVTRSPIDIMETLLKIRKFNRETLRRAYQLKEVSKTEIIFTPAGDGIKPRLGHFLLT